MGVFLGELHGGRESDQKRWGHLGRQVWPEGQGSPEAGPRPQSPDLVGVERAEGSSMRAKQGPSSGGKKGHSGNETQE